MERQRFSWEEWEKFDRKTRDLLGEVNSSDEATPASPEPVARNEVSRNADAFLAGIDSLLSSELVLTEVRSAAA